MYLNFLKRLDDETIHIINSLVALPKCSDVKKRLFYQDGSSWNISILRNCWLWISKLNTSHWNTYNSKHQTKNTIILTRSKNMSKNKITGDVRNKITGIKHQRHIDILKNIKSRLIYHHQHQTTWNKNIQATVKKGLRTIFFFASNQRLELYMILCIL